MSDCVINFALSLALLFLIGAAVAWALIRLWPKILKNQSSSGFHNTVDPRVVLDQAETLIWAEKNQTVIWNNASYDIWFMERELQGVGAFTEQPAASPNQSVIRVRLARTGGLNAAEFCLKKSHVDGVDYYYASSAAMLVDSEQELHRFIQTLTETFAHLPIGLAIFDKKRDLALFNPTLSELLDIPAEWMARRPSLMCFIDRLRSQGIMPEPEDFQSIRQEFKKLESGSINGTYIAEWTLAGGQVYRIVGRPHTKGGLALLFEDISKLVMVERQYRAELEQVYSALDNLADGVAIFDPAGELVFINDAFDDIWDSQLAGALNPVTVIEFSRMLQDKCAPSPAWGDFREFVLETTDRALWHAEVQPKVGGTIHMSFSPIAGGQVFCEFKRVTATPVSVEEMTKNSA